MRTCLSLALHHTADRLQSVENSHRRDRLVVRLFRRVRLQQLGKRLSLSSAITTNSP